MLQFEIYLNEEERQELIQLEKKFLQKNKQKISTFLNKIIGKVNSGEKPNIEQEALNYFSLMAPDKNQFLKLFREAKIYFEKGEGKSQFNLYKMIEDKMKQLTGKNKTIKEEEIFEEIESLLKEFTFLPSSTERYRAATELDYEEKSRKSSIKRKFILYSILTILIGTLIGFIYFASIGTIALVFSEIVKILFILAIILLILGAILIGPTLMIWLPLASAEKALTK